MFIVKDGKMKYKTFSTLNSSSVVLAQHCLRDAKLALCWMDGKFANQNFTISYIKINYGMRYSVKMFNCSSRRRDWNFGLVLEFGDLYPIIYHS